MIISNDFPTKTFRLSQTKKMLQWHNSFRGLRTISGVGNVCSTIAICYEIIVNTEYRDGDPDLNIVVSTIILLRDNIRSTPCLAWAGVCSYAARVIQISAAGFSAKRETGQRIRSRSAPHAYVTQ